MDRNLLLSELGKAIHQFENAMAMPTDDDVMRAGCIQYFEFTFELAWKTVKQIASDQGVQDCNSPKSSLRYAFKNGWIDDEEICLDMLASRNRMSHTYSVSSALVVYDRLPRFVETLKQLEQSLKQVVD